MGQDSAQVWGTAMRTMGTWKRKTAWTAATQQGTRTQSARASTPITTGAKSNQEIRPPQSIVLDSCQARQYPHQKKQHCWVTQCRSIMKIRWSIHQKVHQHLQVNPCRSMIGMQQSTFSQMNPLMICNQVHDGNRQGNAFF
jgi:hypothetical protein